MAVTAYDYVASQFTLPFPAYEFQQKIVNDHADNMNTGLYMDVGTGKTSVSTLMDLYLLAKGEIDHSIILMPPILLWGWGRFMSKIPEVKHLIYEGTPAQRKKLDLGAHEFTFMSYDIFKRDRERLDHVFRKRRVSMPADEATAIKNVGSANHRNYASFTSRDGSRRRLLTGTPLTTPIDAYAYVKLVAPGVYRSKAQFQNIHVRSYDNYGNPKSFTNLELLNENMGINSVRVLAEDVLKDLPPVYHTEVPYTLSNDHLTLYRRLAEEQLLVFDDGSKIDATQQNKLYHALQQIVINYGKFAGDYSKVSQGVVLANQVLEELGGRKLVVVGLYRATNELLQRQLAHAGAVAVYGGNSKTQNRAAVHRFLTDPKCRVIILQPQSGGYGLDGLQEVCSDMLFLECPTAPPWVTQTVARLKRNGQRLPVHVRFAIAQGTLQVRMLRNLLNNDQTINSIVRNTRDLRESLFGG